MNLAILIVGGPDPALASLRQAIPFPVESSWLAGDKMHRGNVHATSGFKLCIADAPHPGEASRAIQAFVSRCIELGVTFGQPGVTAEMSIGFTVGDSVQFFAGYEFSPADMLALSRTGITLSITAYPTSDEAIAEEDAL